MIESIYNAPSMPRHQFHRKYKWVLRCTLLLAVLLGIYCSWALPYHVLLGGLQLLAVVFLYFGTLLVGFRFVPKEIIVGVVYATGVGLGPLFLSSDLQWTDILLVIQLSILAIINLLILSLAEHNEDKQDGFDSWVLRFGLRSTKYL